MENGLNDSTLLDEFKNGDNSSFKTLFLKHKRRIFNYINSKTLDSQISNDILQETFIKVFKLIRKGSYIEQGKFVPWVIRISHNLVMDYYRNKKRSKIIYEKDMKYSFLNVDHEKDFQTESIKSSGKPENVINKILEGKMKKFFEESTLLNQKYVLDPDKTVKNVIEELPKEYNFELTDYKLLLLN